MVKAIPDEVYDIALRSIGIIRCIKVAKKYVKLLCDLFMEIFNGKDLKESAQAIATKLKLGSLQEQVDKMLGDPVV